MNIELRTIAESKVRQLGGDVCGVLVRKDDKLAAVDEHGRVRWLQDDGGEYAAYLEGMNSHLKAELEAVRAQSGQGAEPVALLRREIGESSWFDHTPVRPNTTKAEGLKASVIMDYCEVYTHPQPAQQGGVPEAMTALVAICQHLRDYVDNRGTSIVCDRGVNHFLDALKKAEEVTEQALATTPQPEGDGWARCEDQPPAEVFTEMGTLVDLLRDAAVAEGKVDTCYDEPNKNPNLAVALSWLAGWLPTGLKRPQPPKEGE